MFIESESWKEVTAPRCLINVLLCNMSLLYFFPTFHKNATDILLPACMDLQHLLWARKKHQLDIIFIIITFSLDFCDQEIFYFFTMFTFTCHNHDMHIITFMDKNKYKQPDEKER